MGRMANRFHAAFESAFALLCFWIAWTATRGVKDWDLERHDHVIVAFAASLAAAFGIVALLFLSRSVRALRRLDGEAAGAARAESRE